MNKRKLIITSGIANTFEWYDYALFGHFAPIIGAKFFPESDPSASLLQAFLVFAIGYLMRPIGGVFFGVLGDRFGRKTALSAAVVCMAFPTLLIGILPTYETIGITATILMIIVRMMQGLSMGGALTGSVSFIIEHTGKKRRGFLSSISMSSICVGILLGSSVSYLIKYVLTGQQFYDWGWRIPFVIGIFILFSGIYIRNHTDETPVFEDLREHGGLVISPLKNVMSKYWFDMIISILINSTGSVLFYLQAIYLTSFLKINRGFEDSTVDHLTTLCYIIMAIVTVLAGWLSDLIGRRKIFVIYNVAIILIFSLGMMNIFEVGNITSVIIADIVLAIIAACYIGPEPALQAEFYPTNVRNTALSISYNTATSIFGGTTPFIIELIVQKTGSVSSCMYYILGCSIASLIALYFYKDRSKLEQTMNL
jgi:MHS family proline/betaine transporter-like MFS transporter